MKKIIIIRNCCNITANLCNTDLIKAIQANKPCTDRYNDQVTPYECSLEDLESEVSKGFGADRWIRVIDTESYFIDLIRQANGLLHKQAVGFKVIFNAADEIASIVQMGEGFLYKVGNDFGSTTDLMDFARRLEEYVRKTGIRLLDITSETALPDNFLFDIHIYAEKMEIKMLNELYGRHQKNSKMSLINAERNVSNDDLLKLAVLSGMGFDTVTIEEIEKEKGMFCFSGKTEEGEKICLNQDEMPPKGISYLIEWLNQHNF